MVEGIQPKYVQNAVYCRDRNWDMVSITHYEEKKNLNRKLTTERTIYKINISLFYFVN